jgi:broad specificity phosphatase PhoE
MRVLILVRHGQVAANAHGLLLGRSDPSLNETGHRQACALAAVLPRPARLVSSPLLRARQTALELANAGVGQAVEIDPRWIEMDYGEIEGHPPAVLPEDTWRTWWRDPHFVPAGGESVAAVGARVREACTELAEEAARADVIVVSHVSPIKAALAWALGVGDEVAWRMYLLDAAVCRVDTSGPHPLLLAFNEVHTVAEVVSGG